MLLKAVAMALPAYTMACFKLPKTVCKQIAAVMTEFWWRGNKYSKGMHWRSWDALSKPKSVGGLGFKDIEAFNIALLGKQLWRMLIHKESLLAKVYKSRYFRKSDPLAAGLGSRPSFAWRSIHAAQKLLKRGVRAVVGRGDTINIWQHQWIKAKPARAISSTKVVPVHFQSLVSSISTVKDLTEEDGREWKRELLSLIFSDEDRKSIEEIRPGGVQSKDGFAWDFARSGHYSVKSGYWVLTQVINKEDQPQEVNQPSLNSLYQQV